MSGPLANDRHERFAQNLAEGQTIDAAYAAAGFSPNRGNATRLKANESVRERVGELQGMAANIAALTAADIAKQLDEDRVFAKSVGSAAAMVAATMGKAKVLGLVIDKTHVTGQMLVNVTEEDAGL